MSLMVYYKLVQIAFIITIEILVQFIYSFKPKTIHKRGFKLTFSDRAISSSESSAKPVAELKEGEFNSGISTRLAKIVPKWFNPTLFAVGQEFGSKHLFSVLFASIATITMFSAFPGITPILISTHKSDNPYKSNKRYLATMLQMRSWYQLPNPENLDPNPSDSSASSEPEPAEGDQVNEHLLESLYHVRGIHQRLATNYEKKLASSRSTSKSPLPTKFSPDKSLWAAIQQDLAQSNIPASSRNWPAGIAFAEQDHGLLPLNHLTMSLTQWLLCGPMCLFQEQVGIHGATPEQLKGFTHLWAVIGHAMGMEDEYNVALQPNLEAVLTYYKDVYEAYFLPTLFQIDDDGKMLTEAFYKGLTEAIFGPDGLQIVKVEQWFLLALENVVGIKCPNIRSRLLGRDLVLNYALSQLLALHRFDTVQTATNQLMKRYYFDASTKKVFGFDPESPKDVAKSGYA